MATPKKIKIEDLQADFNEYLKNIYTPSVYTASSEEISNFARQFSAQNDELMAIRCLVQLYSLTPLDEIKSKVLSWYATEIPKIEDSADLAIEAARAAVLFDDCSSAHEFLKHAQTKTQFHPELTGANIKQFVNQSSFSMKVVCLATTNNSSNTSESGTTQGFPNVKLESEHQQLESVEFEDKLIENQATSLLSTQEYAILLIMAQISLLENPENSVEANEQTLPFIRRICDTKEFEQIDFGVQLMALYYRSILETKNINELERGSIQLIKLVDVLKTGLLEIKQPLAFQLLPITWTTIASLGARRLVAMSDFGNAVPYFELLGMNLEVAKCLAAMDKKQEAIEVLSKDNTLDSNPQSLLLKGDLSLDPQFWEQAWQIGQLDTAKFRLFTHYTANEDHQSALKQLQDILEVYPTNDQALFQSGMTLQSLGQWQESITMLKRAAQTTTDNPRIWHNLANAFMQTDQVELAHEALKQAIRTNQNTEPDLDTWCNFGALSAQLNKFEDLIWSLSTICNAKNNAGMDYIVKLRGTLPKLVSTLTSQQFVGNKTQQMLLQLLSVDLLKMIPKDDPTLARLLGMAQLWANQLSEGLQSYNLAYTSALNFLNAEDERTKLRVKLYATEFICALEQYGSREGRIEGSTIFPNGAAKIMEIKSKLTSLNC